MAIAESSLTATTEPVRTLDVAIEGLASAGYQVDVATWQRFVDAGLLHRSSGASPHLILVSASDLKRLRNILDLELRIGLPSSLERLAFFLASAGMSDIPAAKVIEFIVEGTTSFFDASNVELRSMQNLPARLGLDGERALAKRLAAKLLEFHPRAERRETTTIMSLTELGCTMFLRTAWRNRAAGRGPAPRIVTDSLLDADYLNVSVMSAGRPLKSSAAETLMPPAVNFSQAIDSLRNGARFRPADTIAAATDSVTVIERGCPALVLAQAGPLVQSLLSVLAAAFARMRASEKPHTCERIAKSAWVDPEGMRRSLLAHWG